MYSMPKIKAFYRRNGFLKAVVGEPQITYKKEKNGLRIEIRVEEGNRYAFGTASVEEEALRSGTSRVKGRAIPGMHGFIQPLRVICVRPIAGGWQSASEHAS